jgi:hypothetical protein
MRRSIPLLVLVTACGSGEESDSDEIIEVDTYEPCGEVTIDVEGPSAPVVGDSWQVFLHCDDAIMTGAYVVRLDPTDFATIDVNTVTFVKAGTATLKVQSGSQRAEMSVTVTEP